MIFFNKVLCFLAAATFACNASAASEISIYAEREIAGDRHAVILQTLDPSIPPKFLSASQRILETSNYDIDIYMFNSYGILKAKTTFDAQTLPVTSLTEHIVYGRSTVGTYDSLIYNNYASGTRGTLVVQYFIDYTLTAPGNVSGSIIQPIFDEEANIIDYNIIGYNQQIRPVFEFAASSRYIDTAGTEQLGAEIAFSASPICYGCTESNGGKKYIQLAIPFIYGRSFSYEVYLSTYVDAHRMTYGSGPSFSNLLDGRLAIPAAQASADAGNSVYFDKAAIFDETGVEMSFQNLQSASGFDYKTSLTPVPELPNWALLVVGCFTLRLVKSRRRIMSVICSRNP